MWALSGWEHLVGFLCSVQRGQGLRGGQQVVAVKGKLVEMGQVSESPPRGLSAFCRRHLKAWVHRPVCVGSPGSSKAGTLVPDPSSQQGAWHTEGAQLSGSGPSFPRHALPVPFRHSEKHLHMCGSEKKADRTLDGVRLVHGSGARFVDFMAHGEGGCVQFGGRACNSGPFPIQRGSGHRDHQICSTERCHGRRRPCVHILGGSRLGERERQTVPGKKEKLGGRLRKRQHACGMCVCVRAHIGRPAGKEGRRGSSQCSSSLLLAPENF